MNPKPNILETLRKWWGYTGFREGQREVIERVLAGEDTLALMPTGAGKSLLYQLPTLMMEGLCIVVTPLVALMKEGKLDAMMYNVAKEAGARFVALRGEVDAIILTGGIAYSDYCVKTLRSWIDCLGTIVMMPGEDEMGSLAYNALGALRKELPLQVYQPEG